MSGDVVIGHLVVGAGEVGSALADLLRRGSAPVALRDVADVAVCADILHVCIPWGDRFVEDVARYAGCHQAGLVVVHSTVPPGTCDPRGWVHSPVRGSHPHLLAGLETFVKHFGGHRATAAARPFVALGVRVAVHPFAVDVEAGKVWELVQYGVQIRVEKAIHAWCEAEGADFDVVYRAMAETYNEGWRALGRPEFTRPVLQHVPGPVGGHCVVQNARLIDHPLADLVADPERIT